MLAASLAVCALGAAVAGRTEGQQPARASQDLLLFAVNLRPGPSWQTGRPFIEQKGFKEHFAYVRRLFAEGRIHIAGGLGNDHGLILLYARDQADANGVIEKDPAVRAGTFVGEARRFTPAFISKDVLTDTKG